MLPSRRVYWFLLLGVAIAPILSVFTPGETRFITASLILVGVDVLVLAIAIVDGWRSRGDRVQISRQIAERLSIGRDNSVELIIQSGKTPAVLQICDGYPTPLPGKPATLTAVLPANSTETLSYQVYPTDRGTYQWGSIQVRQLSQLGLVWMDWKIPQNQAIAVYPDLIGLRHLSIRLTLQSSGNIRRAQRMGVGTEFSELRDYVTGDDPRLIDWKATARRTRPLVRVLEPEQEQTLIILLDRGRLMTAQVKGLKRFDWGLNATLSLALAGLSRGDRVGVAVFDRQIHTWVPPERGQTQLSKLLDRLTPIQPELLEPDYFGAVSTLVSQQTRRALVVLITDLVDAIASSELLSAMSRLTPRYLPFCVTLRDPEVDVQAHNLSPDVATTYSRAVALDLLAQRKRAFAALKQKGVLVLDAPAHQITEELVDQYLRLKAKGRL